MVGEAGPKKDALMEHIPINPGPRSSFALCLLQSDCEVQNH
jgi:hypothetical protein